MSSRKKILVTGANGQLGKELQGICGNYPTYEFHFMAKDDLPVQQFELVRNVIGNIKPSFCINCAAYTAVDKAEQEKELAFQINGESVGVLAAICGENDCSFIHISTDYVFDGTDHKPYHEDFPPNPINVYGASKLEGEKQALQLNPASTIVRTSWLYSPFGQNFVKTMVKLMKERSEISVVNDQIGSPTYARDLAGALMTIVDKHHESSKNKDPFDNILHYSNDGVISWHEFAEEIKKIMDYPCTIRSIPSSEYRTQANRPSFSVLDKTRIISQYGIQLKDWKVSLKDCLKRMAN